MDAFDGLYVLRSDAEKMSEKNVWIMMYVGWRKLLVTMTRETQTTRKPLTLIVTPT